MMDSTTGQFEIPNANDSSLFPGHILHSGSAPSIVAGAGAGATPTISILGVDNGGTITLTPGIGATGSGATIATITFATAFPTDSAVVLFPANLNAAQLNGIAAISINSSASSFALLATTTGLSSGTQVIYNYVTIGW